MTTLRKEVLQKYPNEIFLELGTHMGDGTQVALDSGFRRVITVEIDEVKHANAKKRFEEVHAVEPLLGTSESILETILPGIDSPMTIWMDAHNNGNCPILRELDIIKIGRAHV